MKAGRTKRNRDLPFVFLNVATTADGKIATANGSYAPFGSKRDHETLLELRSTADAVMAGARTIDKFPVTMGPGPFRFRRKRLQRGLAEYNLRIIVSGSGSIRPNAEIFKHTFSPIILLTTRNAPPARLESLRQSGVFIEFCGKIEIDFRKALRVLREKWGIRRLLCEGGGKLNEALLREGLVDEIHQTLCPIIFGGTAAPTLADGKGVAQLRMATRLRLKSMRRVGDELFLVLTVQKSLSAKSD